MFGGSEGIYAKKIYVREEQTDLKKVGKQHQPLENELASISLITKNNEKIVAIRFSTFHFFHCDNHL